LCGSGDLDRLIAGDVTGFARREHAIEVNLGVFVVEHEELAPRAVGPGRDDDLAAQPDVDLAVGMGIP
jgi:hypothetical protein